jgi:cobalamin biosynthesis protein CobD/CbiB
MASVPAPTGPSAADERAGAAKAHADLEQPRLAELVGGLITDAQLLVRREIDLARAEINTQLGKARQGAVAIGVGVGAATLASILLSFVLVYVLHEALGLPFWLSFLIVGVVFAVIGGVALRTGIKRMQQIDPVPRETIESVRKDIAWIAEPNQSDKT